MRVIAGTAKGRPLMAPRSRQTRPTSDLVRGALFDMLGSLGVRWGRTLDLFAGSGALGIEALSRGARWVDFVERDHAAIEAIRRNLAATGFTARAAVFQMDASEFIRRPREAYDIILADPPYDYAALVPLLEAIAAAGLVAAGGVLVVEHSRRVELPESLGSLTRERQRRHGDTMLSIFRQEARH